MTQSGGLPPATTPQVRRLAAKVFELTQQQAEILAERGGADALVDRAVWSRKLCVASSTPGNRQQAVAKHLQYMTYLSEQAEALFKEGRLSSLHVMKVMYYLEEARAWESSVEHDL